MEKTIKSFREEVQKTLNMTDQEFSQWTGLDLREIYSWNDQEAGVNLSSRSLFLVRIWLIGNSGVFKNLSQDEKKRYFYRIKINHQGVSYSLIDFLKAYALHEVPNYLGFVEKQSKILFQ